MNEKELWFKPDESTNTVPKGSRYHLKLHLWYIVRTLLFSTSFKPFSSYRCWLLRLFGAKIGRSVNISPSVVITIPWLVEIGSHSSLDDGCYILGGVRIADFVSISNNVSFLGGEHNVTSRALSDKIKPIVVDDGAFIGARAILFPGVHIGQMGVVQAGLTVNMDVKENTIVMAYPAKIIQLPRLAEEDYNNFKYCDE